MITRERQYHNPHPRLGDSSTYQTLVTLGPEQEEFAKDRFASFDRLPGVTADTFLKSVPQEAGSGEAAVSHEFVWNAVDSAQTEFTRLHPGDAQPLTLKEVAQALTAETNSAQSHVAYHQDNLSAVKRNRWIAGGLTVAGVAAMACGHPGIGLPLAGLSGFMAVKLGDAIKEHGDYLAQTLYQVEVQADAAKTVLEWDHKLS